MNDNKILKEYLNWFSVALQFNSCYQDVAFFFAFKNETVKFSFQSRFSETNSTCKTINSMIYKKVKTAQERQYTEEETHTTGAD